MAERSPIDQNLGLVVAARSSLPQTRGKFSFKSLTFGHFLYENGQKLSASAAPTRGRTRWGLYPRPPFTLVLRALAMAPFWQILDPPRDSRPGFCGLVAVYHLEIYALNFILMIAHFNTTYSSTFSRQYLTELDEYFWVT